MSHQYVPTTDGRLAALHGRSLTRELDLSLVEWRGLIDLAARLKAEREAGTGVRQLEGRHLALLFAKTSTATRCAFEVAAHRHGAHVTHLDTGGSQLGHRESVLDTGRVLARMVDGIEYRGFRQDTVETLAARCEVPVWNGLSDAWHPTQSLSDMLTLAEHGGGRPLEELSVAYLGDATSNVARSLLVAGAMSGMEVRIVSPPELRTPLDVRRAADRVAAVTGARLLHLTRPHDAVQGVDFVYTDVWVSMDTPSRAWPARLSLLRPYRVDGALLEATGNPEVRFLHCLPAMHDDRTGVGAALLAGLPGESCLEVSDEVFESPASLVFEQAGNRVPVIEAVLVSTL